MTPRGFFDAMRDEGLRPPDSIEPGRLHRFPGRDKGAANRAGWCVLFADGDAGAFGDWSSGLSSTWFARDRCTSADRRHRVGLRHGQAERARQVRGARHYRAAQLAWSLWDRGEPVPVDHAYVQRKRIRPLGARSLKGEIMLPVTDVYGSLASLQFIAADGAKRLLAGGRKQGRVVAVTGLKADARRIIIAEGWATGCTLAEDEPAAMVLSAVDAGNLKSVAMAARVRWPSAALVIAADDDRCTPGNPGATKAREAAIVSGALLALPPWDEGAPEHLTDFNDLAVWRDGGDV